MGVGIFLKKYLIFILYRAAKYKENSENIPEERIYMVVNLNPKG